MPKPSCEVPGCKGKGVNEWWVWPLEQGPWLCHRHWREIGEWYEDLQVRVDEWIAAQSTTKKKCPWEYLDREAKDD